MGYFLGFVSMTGIAVSFVLLIIWLIRKKQVRNILISLNCSVVLFFFAIAITPKSDDVNTLNSQSHDYESTTERNSEEFTELITEETETTQEETTQKETESVTTTEETQPVVTTEKSTKSATTGQTNALKKASLYLDYTAFSYKGLIKQLEFDGFTNEEAVYGADNCGANWKEQAAKKASLYLDYTAFSRQGLIEQLEFDDFTNEEAVYGVEANGY